MSSLDVKTLAVLAACAIAGYFLVSFLSSLERKPRVISGNEGITQEKARQLLGVSETATHEELKSCFHKALAQYHPDMTQHLGQELRELAERKTREIIEAYHLLSSR